MDANRRKWARRRRRKRHVRKGVFGDAERPRCTVSRSLRHIGAQLVDDERGVTLCAASTADKELRDKVKDGGNVAAAKVVGEVLAERARAKGVTAVRFDRNGYKYCGRVKSLADGAREGGLNI